MLIDVVEVRPVKDYVLFIKFEDGLKGEIDLSKIIQFKGVFEPLKDVRYFASVKLNPDLGTIVWDNGADIAPERLYQVISQHAA